MYYSNNQNQNSNNSKIEQQQSLKTNQDNITKQQSTKNNDDATKKDNLNNYNNNGHASPIIIKVENGPDPIESALSADGSALKQEDEGRIVSPPPPGPRPQIKISVGINMNLVRPRTKPNPDPTVSPIVAPSSPQPRKVISCIMPSWFISKDTQQQQQQKQQQNPVEKSKLDFSPSMLHDLPSDSMCSMHLERTKLEPIESSDIYLYVKKPVKDQPTVAEGTGGGGTGGKGQNGKQSKSASKSLTYELLHIKPFVPFKPKPRTKPFIPQLKPMFATTGDDDGKTSQNKVSKQKDCRKFSYQELLDIKPFVPIKPKPRTKPFIPQLKPTAQTGDGSNENGQSPTKVAQQFPNSTVAKSAPGAMQPNGTGAGNPTAAFTADSKCRLQLKRPARPSCYTPNYHKAPFIEKHSSGSSSLNNAKQTPSLIADLPSTEVQSLFLEKSQLVPIEDSFYFQWKDRLSKLFINSSRSANAKKLSSPLAAIRFNSDGAIDYKLSKTRSDPPAVSKPSPSTLADLPSTSACSIHLERKELVPIESSEPFLFQPHQQQQKKLKKNQTKHAKKSTSSESPLTKTTTPVFKLPIFGEQIPDLKFLAIQARSMFKIDMLEKPPSSTEERAKEKGASVAPSTDITEIQTKVSEVPQSSITEDKVSTPSKSKPKTIPKIETLSSTIRSDSKQNLGSPVAPSKLSPSPPPPTSNTIKKQQEALSETIRSSSQNVLAIKPPSPTAVAPSTSPEPLIVVRAKTSKLGVPFQQQQQQRTRTNQYGEKGLKDSPVPNNVKLTTSAPPTIDYVDTMGLLSALLNTPQPPPPPAAAAAALAQPAQTTTTTSAAAASASSSPSSSSHPKNKPNKILSLQRNVSLYKNLANTGNSAGGGATTVAETKLKTNNNKGSVRTSGGGGSAGSGGNKPAATNHHYHRAKPLIKHSNLAVMPATTAATRPQQHRTTTPKPETRIQRHRNRTPHKSRQNSPKTVRGRTSNKPAAHHSHNTPTNTTTTTTATTSPNTNQHPIVLSSSFASSPANSNATAPVSIPAATTPTTTRAPATTTRKPHQNSINRAKVNVTNQKNHKSLSPTTAPPPSSTPAPTQNNKNKNKSKKSTNTTATAAATNKDQQQTAPPSTDFDYKEPKLIKSNPKQLSNKTGTTTNTNNTTNTSKSNNKHTKNSDSTNKSKAKPGVRTTIAKPPHRWTSYFFRRPPKSS